MFIRLIEAYKLTIESSDQVKLEAALWTALNVALKTFAKTKTKLIILVDGLDEVSGGEAAASSLFKRLHALAVDYGNVRAVITSKTVFSSPHGGIRRLQLTPDQVHDDLRRSLMPTLLGCKHFLELSQAHRDELVDRVAHAANGNFLWAKLVIKSARNADSKHSFQKAVQEAPKSLPELIQKFCEPLGLSKGSSHRSILTWVLVAVRPFTLPELNDLIRTDAYKNASEIGVDISELITDRLDFFLGVQDGIVRFRHGAIRRHFLDLSQQGKLMPSLKEAHKDVTARLMQYCKASLTHHYEPSFDLIETILVESLVKKHDLLKYAVSYWVQHYRKSSFNTEDAGTDISAEFKSLFAGSTIMVMLEWILWDTRYPLLEALELQELTFNIRRKILGAKSKAVLQCLVILTKACSSLRNSQKTIKYSYEAFTLAKEVLVQFDVLTIRCTTVFLEYTENYISTTRTEIITHKEVVLKFMISMCKHRHGANSTQVIHWMEYLAKMYMEIREEDSARIIYEEINEIIIRIYGHSSDEARSITEKILFLKKKNNSKPVEGYAESLFHSHEKLVEITTVKQITFILQTAREYESRGEILRAEEMYVNVWIKVIELCRIHSSEEWQIAKLDVAIAFVQFLERQKRYEEASSIVICIWEEYGQSTFQSEIIVMRIKIIAEVMKSIGLLTLAVTVFKSIFSYFKSIGKSTSHEATSTSELITKTVEIITQETQSTSTTISTSKSTTTSSTTTTTTMTTAEIKSTMREIFESSFSETSVTSTEVRSRIIKASSALIKIHMLEENFSEATEVIRKTLEICWKVLVTGVGMIALPEVCVTEVINIAYTLAVCYRRQQLFEKAEEIYIRIYQACIFSLKIHDERVALALSTLVDFYEEHHCHEKTIDVYIDILHIYRRQLGASHDITIKALYTLASLCIKYGRKIGYEYYAEIVAVLNKGHKFCHRSALDAAVILVEWYYVEERWTDVKNLCEVISATFHHDHKEHKFEARIVELVYTKYISVLEHLQVEYMEVRKVSLSYREICTTIFGASASITISAMITVAKISERHEKYYEEAVSIYEEVIKKTSTTTTTSTTTISTTTTTTLKEVKQRLSTLYVKVITSSSSTSVSTTTIERAITLKIEHHEQVKKEWGCWHESTLTTVKELVILYLKLETSETHGKINSFLQNFFLDVVRTENSAQQLFHAAVILAEVFTLSHRVEFGLHLLQQIRGWLITQDKNTHKDLQIQVSSHRAKECYIFLAAFEYKLRGVISISYSQIMAEIFAEAVLYHRFMQLVETKSSVEVVVLHGALLCHFLRQHKRHSQLRLVEERVYEIFMTQYGSIFKTKTEITFMFLTSILEEIGKSETVVDMDRAACVAGVVRVKALLEHGQYQQAFEVGSCAFQFASARKLYHRVPNIEYGFKLSQYLAGRLVKRSIEAKLREQMVELSMKIIREVLAACQEADIDVVRLKYSDLDELVGLLGEQKNFTDLERLLTKLWASREVQKGWSREEVIGVGRALVRAYAGAGKQTEAVRLCENICYNLRRVKGLLHKLTLDMYCLLAEVYGAAGRWREAMGVHEDLIRVAIQEDEDFDEDGEPDYKLERAQAVELVVQQLQLLRLAHARLGGWDKSERAYHDLYAMAAKKFGDEVTGKVSPVEKWAGKADKSLEAQVGAFVMGEPWTIRKYPNEPVGSSIASTQTTPTKGLRRPQNQVKRATSNWGLNDKRLTGDLKNLAQISAAEVNGANSVA